MSIYLLYIVDVNVPTFRADIAVLFGKYLPHYDIKVDLVAGKKKFQVEPDNWKAGKKFLCSFGNHKLLKHLIAFSHFSRHLFTSNLKFYNAIQVRNMPLPATIGLIAARLRGKHFFFWMSYPTSTNQIQRAQYKKKTGEGFFNSLYPLIRGKLGIFLLDKVVLPHSDHIFVQSDRMKKEVTLKGISPLKITPVPMGTDFLNKFILPIDDPRLKNRRILVYLGTVDPVRRIDILLEMLAIVKKIIPNVHLVIIGDTEDKNHLRWLHEQSTKFGINNHILWTGWLPQYKALQYVKASEIGLSPFPRSYLLDSASPTKILEYIAMGIPVVCNDNPDQLKLISKTRSGYCVSYTAVDFSKAVISLLLKDSSVMRKEIKTRGISYLSKYRAYEQIGKNLGRIYHNLLKVH